MLHRIRNIDLLGETLDNETGKIKNSENVFLSSPTIYSDKKTRHKPK